MCCNAHLVLGGIYNRLQSIEHGFLWDLGTDSLCVSTIVYWVCLLLKTLSYLDIVSQFCCAGCTVCDRVSWVTCTVGFSKVCRRRRWSPSGGLWGRRPGATERSREAVGRSRQECSAVVLVFAVWSGRSMQRGCWLDRQCARGPRTIRSGNLTGKNTIRRGIKHWKGFSYSKDATNGAPGHTRSDRTLLGSIFVCLSKVNSLGVTRS